MASETVYQKVGEADKGENIQDGAKNKLERESKLWCTYQVIFFLPILHKSPLEINSLPFC